MMHGQFFQRLQRIDPIRRRLLIRALITLAGSSAAVAVLPFSRAIGFGGLPLGESGVAPPIADVVWAVQAAARRVPWRAKCIEQGLAVQRLLRKSGCDALLHYGARHEPSSGRLQAHVWITVDGDTVIGGEEAREYKEIATFP